MSTAFVSLPTTAGERSAAFAWQTSMPPNASTAVLISACTDSSSATSTDTAIAVPPAAVMPSATSLAAASFRSPTTTRAPSSASRREVALPMPPAPPATTATLSWSPRIRRASRERPLREPDVVRHLAEDDRERGTDLDRVGVDRVEGSTGARYDVAHEADRGVVLQFHDD